MRWRLRHQRMPGFWKAAILAWAKLPITRLEEPKVMEAMMAEPLWFNEMVVTPKGDTLHGGKWVKWAKGKFHKVKDLWSPLTNTWFTAEEASQWVPKRRAGEWEALLGAIPVAWKQAMELGATPLQKGEWASGVDEGQEDLAEPHGKVVGIAGPGMVVLQTYHLNEEGVLAPTGGEEEVSEDFLVRTRVVHTQVKKRKFYQLAGELEDLVADPTKWGLAPTKKGRKPKLAVDLSIRDMYQCMMAPTKKVHKLPWKGVGVKEKKAKLKRLASKGVDKKAALHMTKVMHKRLFIGDRIVKHAASSMREASRCPCCGGLETHTHLYYECVKGLVRLFLSWWNRCTGQKLVVRKKVEWVMGMFAEQTHGPVWDKLHTEAIYSIWLERCTAKHEGSERPPIEVMWRKLHEKIRIIAGAELYLARKAEAIAIAQGGIVDVKSADFQKISPVAKWQRQWLGLAREEEGVALLTESGLDTS